jgi:hypothetical protein
MLYQRTMGRVPTATECKLALEFLNDQGVTIRENLKAGKPLGIPMDSLPKGADPAAVRAIADLCIVIFNTNEFVHIP